jgi:hypothetical protein
MESVTASQRALIVLGVVLFLAGAAAGFGVGFGIGHDQTKTVATTPSSARRTLTPLQTQRRNQFLSCMADHGVKWPSVPGGPQIAKPPVGVSKAKYNTAFAACYKPTGTSATTTT